MRHSRAITQVISRTLKKSFLSKQCLHLSVSYLILGAASLDGARSLELAKVDLFLFSCLFPFLFEPRKPKPWYSNWTSPLASLGGARSLETCGLPSWFLFVLPRKPESWYSTESYYSLVAAACSKEASSRGNRPGKQTDRQLRSVSTEYLTLGAAVLDGTRRVAVHRGM